MRSRSRRSLSLFSCCSTRSDIFYVHVVHIIRIFNRHLSFSVDDVTGLVRIRFQSNTDHIEKYGYFAKYNISMKPGNLLLSNAEELEDTKGR